MRTSVLLALMVLSIARPGGAQGIDEDDKAIRAVVNVAANEASRTRVIDVVDKVGSAAMVKATLKHGATTFTDYFVLLKADGNWRIANKVYHAAR